jgi:hypothetical protein
MGWFSSKETSEGTKSRAERDALAGRSSPLPESFSSDTQRQIYENARAEQLRRQQSGS